MQPYFSTTSIDYLESTDFVDFAALFEQQIDEKIPHSGKIYFVDEEKLFETLPIGEKPTKQISEFLGSQDNLPFHFCEEGLLVLSVLLCRKPTLLIVTNVDLYFSKRVSKSWLQELIESLSNTFLQLKRANTDLETGLRNSQSLFNMLSTIEAGKEFTLVLVEIYPSVRSAKEARLQTFKAIQFLNHFSNEESPLFHLGHFVYGYILTEDEKGAWAFVHSLLFRLKQNGFKNVHIGIRRSRIQESLNSNESRQIVDEAWHSLQGARKKGPFGICDFYRFSNEHLYPIKKVDRKIIAKLSKLWTRYDSFSLLLFAPKSENDRKLLLSQLEEKYSLIEGEDIYMFLPNSSPADAHSFANKLLKQIHSEDIRVGVGYYPLSDYPKKSAPQQCIKTLHHSEFLGKNGIATFDSTSLNISGDIYYAEGDLVSAVREYKNGLRLDSNDVNLLNSLGVAYVDMNRYRQARKCFDDALNIDGENFMALYNAGLTSIHFGSHREAINFFKKVQGQDSEFPEMQDNLQFQLGVLYCTVRDYEKGVSCLLPWYKKNQNIPESERASEYLAKAYFGLNQLQESVVWLQRALAFNEYNAGCMALLGVVYLKLNEGDDIALSLIEKGIDLEPSDIKLRLYLAMVQIKMGRYSEARLSLKSCLRNKNTVDEAQKLMCESYKKQGLEKRADFWKKKMS